MIAVVKVLTRFLMQDLGKVSVLNGVSIVLGYISKYTGTTLVT